MKAAPINTVLEFCNDVRKAGGANPLDALMPAVPADVENCIIARNLNFSCDVFPVGGAGEQFWVMGITDYDVAQRIISELGDKWGVEEYSQLRGIYRIKLPPDIAQVAIDFDEWELAMLYDKVPSTDLVDYLDEDYKETLIEEGILNPDGTLI